MTDTNDNVGSAAVGIVNSGLRDRNQTERKINEPVQAHRNFTRIVIQSRNEFVGNKAVFKGGELATLLKDNLASLGGVTLHKITISIIGRELDSEIAVCLASNGDGITCYSDIIYAANSQMLSINASNKAIRTMLDVQLPSGVGTQLVPCDPFHPAIHFFVGTTAKFTGQVVIRFEISCDKLTLMAEDNLFR